MGRTKELPKNRVLRNRQSSHHRSTNQPTPLYPASRLVYTALICGLKVLKLRSPFREPMVDGRSLFLAHAFPPFLPPTD